MHVGLKGNIYTDNTAILRCFALSFTISVLKFWSFLLRNWPKLFHTCHKIFSAYSCKTHIGICVLVNRIFFKCIRKKKGYILLVNFFKIWIFHFKTSDVKVKYLFTINAGNYLTMLVCMWVCVKNNNCRQMPY